LEEDVIGNLQIIGNPRLQDISTLDNLLKCEAGIPESVDPMAVLGVIQVVPPENKLDGTSCLISTAQQARTLSPPPSPPSHPRSPTLELCAVLALLPWCRDTSNLHSDQGEKEGSAWTESDTLDA